MKITKQTELNNSTTSNRNVSSTDTYSGPIPASLLPPKSSKQPNLQYSHRVEYSVVCLQPELHNKAHHMETEEAQALTQPNDYRRSVEFRETEIVKFSQQTEPCSIQNQCPSEVQLHKSSKTNEKLREKDKAMVSQEANVLGDKSVSEERRVQFGEGSLVEVTEDIPIVNSLKYGQTISLSATADNQNPEVKQKNKRMEIQEAQALLNPLPRNDNKKVQFSSASLISEKTQSGRSTEKCLNVGSDSNGTDIKTKEKSKCMELEEAQALRNPSITNENRKVQFGLTKLIEVSEEEPPLLSPKEERTIELYPTPDTQKYEVKEKSKKMEAEEAQALRKPMNKAEAEEENSVSQDQIYTKTNAILCPQPTSTNGV